MTTSPIERGAAAMGDTKASTTTNKASAAPASSGFNMAEWIAKAQASNTGNAVKGPVYTQQEADAAVQSIAQQLLGRNVTGIDYTKAVKAYLNQSQDTSIQGRQGAVINYLTGTQEYKAREENKYLDAIYNAVAADVRKVR